MNALKDRYPFLVDWKKRGKKEFPKFPKEALIKITIHNDRKALANKILTSEVRIPPQIEIIDATTEKQWISLIHDARSRILSGGEAREKVGRDLLNKLLPETKGGTAFNNNQAIILKYVHRELQELIKEFRRKLDMPLQQCSGVPPKEDIEKIFPEILELIYPNEIEILSTESSISKSSLKIIKSRLLHSPNINHKVSIKSLQNILSKISLP